MITLNTGDQVVNNAGTLGDVIEVSQDMACVEFSNGRTGWFDRTDDDRLGPTWNVQTLQRDFEVIAFAAPFVVVARKSDGAKGTLEFGHRPRVYFDFKPEETKPAPLPPHLSFPEDYTFAQRLGIERDT